MSSRPARGVSVATITIVGSALCGGFGPGVAAAIDQRPEATPVTIAVAAPAAHPRDVRGAEVVRLSVPDVVLPKHLSLTGGRLRVPVVLAAPQLAAVASVPGTASCTARLAPSVVTWIDCVPGPGAVVLVVHVSDGRTVVRSSVDDRTAGTAGSSRAS